MKLKFIIPLLAVLICSTLHSCSDDDVSKDDQENEVTFKVISNTPEAPITISEFLGEHLTIKDYWEGKYVTKKYSAQFSASCEDPEVLITGEIYVNGKLQLKREGNRYIQLTVNNIKR